MFVGFWTIIIGVGNDVDTAILQAIAKEGYYIISADGDQEGLMTAFQEVAGLITSKNLACNEQNLQKVKFYLQPRFLMDTLTSHLQPVFFSGWKCIELRTFIYLLNQLLLN